MGKYRDDSEKVYVVIVKGEVDSIVGEHERERTCRELRAMGERVREVPFATWNAAEDYVSQMRRAQSEVAAVHWG